MSKEAGSNGNGRSDARSFEIKVGLAEMLKGGVIMDVVDPDQAKIAEQAGACAVMAHGVNQQFRCAATPAVDVECRRR